MDVKFGNDPIWVPADPMERMMVLNPKMFVKLGERDDGEDLFMDAEDIQPKEELEVPEIPEDLVCEKCGKHYKATGRGPEFYNDHIEKCEPEE